jgi:hypothetical protein
VEQTAVCLKTGWHHRTNSQPMFRAEVPRCQTPHNPSGRSYVIDDVQVTEMRYHKGTLPARRCLCKHDRRCRTNVPNASVRYSIRRMTPLLGGPTMSGMIRASCPLATMLTAMFW